MKRESRPGKMRQRFLLRIINWWPPLFGAGIRVVRSSADLREIDVELRLRFWNRNYVGTQYGGSMYSMTDPFYMVMLLENLGSEFIIWDKAATIRFKKPGRGTIRAQFRLTQDRLDELRQQLTTTDKIEPTFLIEIKDEEDEIVAEVEKLIYIRRKQKDVSHR